MRQEEYMKLTNRRMTRRGMLRTFAVGTTGVAAISLVGCGGDDDEPAPTLAPTATQPPATVPTSPQLSLVSGWYRDADVRYYDFGMNTPVSGGVVATAPIFAFITGMDEEGNPLFVDGQHNVVDAVPGDAGYSDLWEVNLVVVPDDYEPDSIKSQAEVGAMDYEIIKPGLLVNCPIVADGTTLEGGEELVQGWNNGEAVFYPDFGGNMPFAIPIWAFITGTDSDGAPVFVDGQRNVIDAVPDDPGYSAFWSVNLVTVPESYVANTLRSASAISDSDFEVTATDLVVNCPVTEF